MVQWTPLLFIFRHASAILTVEVAVMYKVNNAFLQRSSLPVELLSCLPCIHLTEIKNILYLATTCHLFLLLRLLQPPQFLQRDNSH